MAENTTFSSSGLDAITRTVDVSVDHTADALVSQSQEAFEDYYEIERTIEWIVKGDYKRITLQFPDELLHDSVSIYRALKRKLEPYRELYVLADTSYGSCCVDEVAAQHVEADALVHYGHACMSKVSRLSVTYVFGRKPLDVDHCVSQFGLTLSPKKPLKVVLKHDVSFSHIMDEVVSKLGQILDNIPILYTPPAVHETPSETLPTSDATAPASNGAPSNPDPRKSEDDCTILYVGGESLGLTNLLMTHSFSKVYTYDPATRQVQLESTRTNKLLMRRYAVIQRAKDADVFGILVGTLGVASYLPLISHLRNVLRRAHKKSYTISVGKLNPAKLGNFMEVECFVLVACPENSFVEARDFLRPIVTPFELEIALQAEQSWTGRYVLDFETLLKEQAQVEAEDPRADDGEQPVFSLVTGQYRHTKRYGDKPTADEDFRTPTSAAVVLRNQENALAVLGDSAAGEFLQNRSFRGLEVRAGEDAPSVLEQGRSGIARGYQDDHS